MGKAVDQKVAARCSRWADVCGGGKSSSADDADDDATDDDDDDDDDDDPSPRCFLEIVFEPTKEVDSGVVVTTVSEELR
jgi:hypothetical protein